ncbi:MAG TPA: putative sulfate exporter family transporter, partial [Planctomycetes bacterium]|nr:putative sulfate exporter family transporter [Planctomycetota bacterium]
RPGPGFGSGIQFCEKQLLSVAIALMGVNLDFGIVKELGLSSLALVVAGVAVTITAAMGIGKLLGFDHKFALLLGIGNGVCGSSAIAATEQIIGANEEEVGLSVAIVNGLGTLGIFVLPLVARSLFHFSDLDSGLLVGNTLQAVGQVVAAGFSINEMAGQTATIIKMTRILMLFPLVFVLIFAFAKSGKGQGGKKPKVPLFILGFILFSLVPTFGLLSAGMTSGIKRASHYLLIVAMAGIGLKITFDSILRDGKAALLTGGLVFLVQIVFSSLVVFVVF